MRHRDRITIGVLSGLVALNLATCAVAAWFFVRVDRKNARAIADLRQRIADAESAVANAAGVALASAARSAPGSDDPSDDQPAPAPQILGFGQSRSVAAIYPYCDIRQPDGSVERKYLARIPFSEAKGGEGAPTLSGADGVYPP